MIALLLGLAGAAEEPRELGPLGVETDPLTTPLGARNVFLYVEPPSVPHISASVGLFASDFPDWMDEMLGYRNRGEGFDVRVRLSPAMTLDWFFKERREGWHAGTFLFLWRYEARRGGEVARFENLVVLPRVGYRWFPFKKLPLYLDPFLGVMSEVRVGGDNALDGGRVRATPLLPFASMHLGLHL